MSKIDEELNAFDDELNKLKLTHKVEYSQSSIDDIDGEQIGIINDNVLYELRGNAIIKYLNIKLGSSELPRFSCVSHKLNLAIRHAINNHPGF